MNKKPEDFKNVTTLKMTSKKEENKKLRFDGRNYIAYPIDGSNDEYYLYPDHGNDN